MGAMPPPGTMTKYLYRTSLLLFIVVSLMPIANAEQKYSVGVVPQFEARRIAEIWQPILDEVSRLSGIDLDLKTSSSIPVFEKQLSEGEFDFAYMNPYIAILANTRQGYTPLVRDTGRNLFGIIVVRKDSPIQSVSELAGKTVAFPAPNALGASLIPRAEFARKFNISVNEIYVKSHSSVYLNVLLGKAAAGGGVQKTLSQQAPEIRDQLRVLYRTSEVPPHPLSSHPRVDANVRQKVKAAFLALGTSSEGPALLGRIPMKKIGDASIDDYAPLKEMGLDQFYVDQ